MTRGSKGVEVVGGMHAGSMAAPPLKWWTTGQVTLSVVDFGRVDLGNGTGSSGIQAGSVVLSGWGSMPCVSK